MAVSVRLLHTSDVHLEWLFEGFPEDARRRRRAEVAGALARVVDLAIEHRVGGLLVSGDLFHGDAPSLSARAEVSAQFSRLDRAGVPVLVIPGNHDRVTGRSPYRLPRFPANVHVFSGEGWSARELPGGVRVYGLPYRSQDAGRRVLEGFSAHRQRLDREREATGQPSCAFRVGMVHGSLWGLSFGPDAHCPIQPEDIESSGLDYLALGHYHDFQDCSRGPTKASYPGAPARLTFANLSPRRAVLVELGDGPARLRPLELADREYRVLEWDLSRRGLEGLYEELAAGADPEVALKVVLQGWPAEPLAAFGEAGGAAAGGVAGEEALGMGGGSAGEAPAAGSAGAEGGAAVGTWPGTGAASAFDPRTSLDRFRSSYFHLEVVDRTAPAVAVEAGDRTVRGLFISRVQERLARAENPEEAAVLRRALVLGLEALAGRRPG
ncbi:MAG: DNA repair exonuclease [Acetobacteraceae bacterium]|nr:DNA repair exonuclease [Acetobacteraceae bacterium]